MSRTITKRDRSRLAGGKRDYGRRPVNDWGSGDLPAPFAIGDLVHLLGGDTSRFREVPTDRPVYVVTNAYSIDQGDAWYFRVGCVVTEDRPDGIYEWDVHSDRHHVAYAARSSWDEDVDWMACFELVDTADPDGLAEREALLAAGWSFEERWQTCPTCGHKTTRPAVGLQERNEQSDGR